MRTVCRCEAMWQAQQALAFYSGGTADTGPSGWGEVPLVYRIEKEDDVYVIRGYTDAELRTLGGNR